MLEVFDHGIKHVFALFRLAMILIQVESQIQIVEDEATLQGYQYLRHLLDAKLAVAEIELHDEIVPLQELAEHFSGSGSLQISIRQSKPEQRTLELQLLE